MDPNLDERWRPPAEVRPAIKAVCLRLIPPIQEAARAVGYAVAVHGSLERDLDLVACPWTDKAKPERDLVKAIRLAVAKELGGKCLSSADFTEKPHGRHAYTLLLFSDSCVESHAGSHPFIDLSVMPRAT